MKKITVAFLVAAGIFASSSSAKVSFNLKVDSLTSGENTLSDKGLLVLVVDADDTGIDLPGVDSFGDEVLAKWDLDDGPGNAGITLLSGGVEIDDSWVGQPLALLWFPSLTDSDLPSGTEEYGIFTDSVGFTSGGDWEMPENGAIGHSLNLITASATTLVMSGYGEVPDSAAEVLYAVNGDSPATTSPEPTMLTVESPVNGASTLSWTGDSVPTGGYIIQRKRPSSSNWETIGFSAVTKYSDDSVVPGLSYDYQILSQSGIASARSATSLVIEAERSYFKNVSARSKVLTAGASKMFGGFRVAGKDPTKNILVQALGSSFFENGVSKTFIADPSIVMVSHPNADFSDTEDVINNNDWLSATNALDIEDATSNVGLSMATDSKDAAGLIVAVTGLPYTFTVDSEDGGEKDVVLGIFNADYKDGKINDNRLVNLSARGYLGTKSSEILAGGVIIEGNVPKEILVMAWGPYLGGLGLNGTVPNPTLKLTKLSTPQVILASNDDWQNQVSSPGVETSVERISAALKQLGYAPFADGSKDALLLVTLDPGAYVFQVDDAGGSDGLALISLDEVEME